MKRPVANGAGLAERQSVAVPPHRPGDVRRESRHRGTPRSGLEFPGCHARPMTRAQYEAHEGRVEFFDSRAEIAWMVREPTHAPHEEPRERLAALLARIAQVRGSPIKCLGATEIRGPAPGAGEPDSIHPDQMVFLHPDRTRGKISRYLDVGEDPCPDVVVEVDSTTDVRRNRLKLYEEWGFPELWVEVPDACAPSRPAGLRSGLRIHLLEGGRYVPSEESRAFPGWRAVEIHRALNEWVVSEETSAVLSRVAGRSASGRAPVRTMIRFSGNNAPRDASRTAPRWPGRCSAGRTWPFLRISPKVSRQATSTPFAPRPRNGSSTPRPLPTASPASSPVSTTRVPDRGGARLAWGCDMRRPGQRVPAQGRRPKRYAP